MTAVVRAAALLRGLRDSDRISELCLRHGVDLMAMFGSAGDRPSEAGDLDVAVRFGAYEARRVLPLLDDLMGLLDTSAMRSSPRACEALAPRDHAAYVSPVAGWLSRR